jgi:photosystem II stability/assembly factor-like uncharacterized protein
MESPLANNGFIFALVIALFLCCKKEDNLPPPKDWEWEQVGTSLDDISVFSITVHPNDSDVWLVTSMKGFYITENGGQSWDQIFHSQTGPVAIDPVEPDRIFVGFENKLFRSEDRGKNWEEVFTFEGWIREIMVSSLDQAVFIGMDWLGLNAENGMFRSYDQGDSFSLFSFGLDTQNLLNHHLEEDPANGILYCALEIADHPVPYRPPLLRSTDRGEHWEEISGDLPWHVVKLQVHPQTHAVYALTEGSGLYVSVSYGDQWTFLNNDFWLDFVIHPEQPELFFGGTHTSNESPGGVFFSEDTGKHFDSIGLEGQIVGNLTIDPNTGFVYVASNQSGLFRSR